MGRRAEQLSFEAPLTPFEISGFLKTVPIISPDEFSVDFTKALDEAGIHPVNKRAVQELKKNLRDRHVGRLIGEKTRVIQFLIPGTSMGRVDICEVEDCREAVEDGVWYLYGVGDSKVLDQIINLDVKGRLTVAIPVELESKVKRAPIPNPARHALIKHYDTKGVQDYDLQRLKEVFYIYRESLQ